MSEKLKQFTQFKNDESKNFLKKIKKVLDIENKVCQNNEVACENNSENEIKDFVRTLIIKQ